MSSGGARDNSGGARPNSGPKVGNKKGGIHSTTRKKLELAESLVGTGRSPLEYLLAEMHDDSLPRDLRHQAAVAAAPYVHSKMPTVNINENHEMTHEDWLAELEEAVNDDERLH